MDCIHINKRISETLMSLEMEKQYEPILAYVWPINQHFNQSQFVLQNLSSFDTSPPPELESNSSGAFESLQTPQA